jgi:hypothetical protein
LRSRSVRIWRSAIGMAWPPCGCGTKISASTSAIVFEELRMLLQVLGYYYYPGSKNPGVVSADTWEIYGAIGWKWASVKVSYNLDDYFGLRPNGQKTDGTYYIDASATYPVGETGWALIGHYGYLDVKHDLSGDSELSYSDWKLGASYTIPDGVLKGLELGAYYTGNNAKSLPYTDLTNYDTSKDRGVFYVKKTF